MIEGHWSYHPQTDHHVEYWLRCDQTMICVYPPTQDGRNIWGNWSYVGTQKGPRRPPTFQTRKLKAAWARALREPLFLPCTCSSDQVLLSEFLLLELEKKGLIKL